jgi:hypothetical protein
MSQRKVEAVLESLAQVEVTAVSGTGLSSTALGSTDKQFTLCQTPAAGELPPALKLLEFSLVGFAVGAGGSCITSKGWGDLPVARANFSVDALLHRHENHDVFWGQLGTVDDLTSLDTGYQPGNLRYSTQAVSQLAGKPIKKALSQ